MNFASSISTSLHRPTTPSFTSTLPWRLVLHNSTLKRAHNPHKDFYIPPLTPSHSFAPIAPLNESPCTCTSKTQPIHLRLHESCKPTQSPHNLLPHSLPTPTPSREIQKPTNSAVFTHGNTLGLNWKSMVGAFVCTVSLATSATYHVS